MTYTAPTFVNGSAPALNATNLNALFAEVQRLSALVNTIAGEPSGDTVTVLKDPTTGFWPAAWNADGTASYTGGSTSTGVRPTSRADITVVWKGPDPSPAIVSTGTLGMLNNVDYRLVTP